MTDKAIRYIPASERTRVMLLGAYLWGCVMDTTPGFPSHKAATATWGQWAAQWPELITDAQSIQQDAFTRALSY